MNNTNIHEQTPELTKLLNDYLNNLPVWDCPLYRPLTFDFIRVSIFLSHN